MKIHFDYSGIFDLHTSELMGKELDQSLAKKARELIPRISKEWEKEGALLLKTAQEISGFSFKRNEITCTIITGDFVSMSHPFILNIKKYIDSDELKMLSEVIFHELLHILLTDNFKVWPTKEIENVETSDRTIQSHLHLMSLEYAVHEKLGNHKKLEAVSDWYRRIGGAYQETWELVSLNDRYLEFVNEFKDSTQWS